MTNCIEADVSSMIGICARDTIPLVSSKTEENRCLNIHEDDELDEAQVESCVKQACQLTGVKL